MNGNENGTGIENGTRTVLGTGMINGTTTENETGTDNWMGTDNRTGNEREWKMNGTVTEKVTRTVGNEMGTERNLELSE